MQTRSSFRLALAGILLSAAFLLLVGSWFCYTSTFDTATVGLMSVNILHGERPLFYYGQPYFGALEAYLAALYLALFGFSEFVVSLSPITFALGWVFFSYLLFTRIHNRTAGIIAAACTAFPGYYVFWYSIATYGGYSVILCVGTAILWLCLRMVQENVRKVSLVLHSVCIGLLIGLGIWVHPLTYPYIVIGAGILGVLVVKERFRPDILLALASAVLIALVGFLPFYLETGSFFGGISESVQLSRSFIFRALSNLFAVNIFELVVWNFRHIFHSPWVRYLIEYGGLSILGGAFLLALYAVMTSGRSIFKKYNALVPLSYCLLFLALYVQHHMATVKAPRYAIGFWSMLLCGLWVCAICGQPRRGLKKISIVLFCLWIGYQITGTVLFITGNRTGTLAEQAAVRDVVSAAREKNLTSVVTYGDPLFGLKSLKFSMFSQNRIVFSHADLERYQGNAQVAETDLNRGYLTTAEYKTSLENLLKELKVDFDEEKIHNYFLFSGLQPKQQFVMRSIPAEELQPVSPMDSNNRKAERFLVDRNQDMHPVLKNMAGKALSFDTGRIRQLCGLWMFSPQDPSVMSWKGPGQYVIAVSSDGVFYQTIHQSLPGTGSGFHAGPTVYIGGPWGEKEFLFSPVSARYIRITFVGKSSSPATELFFFQTDGSLRRDDPDEIAKLARVVREQDLDYVLADRWVSAGLREAFRKTAKADIALPRHSTRFKNRPLLRFIRPEKGQALVCARAVAEECEQELQKEYGQSVISKRFDRGNYVLFSLADVELNSGVMDRSALLWNGHVPLQTRDITLLAPWFNKMGFPIWRADFSSTKGIYHDSWTNGKGIFYDLEYRVNPEKDRELVIYTHGWRPAGDIADLQLRVLVNKGTPLQFKEKKEKEYIFSLPEDLNELDRITVESTTFVPNSQDARSLGLDIDRIEIQ
ncbi:MAG TPA: hypothetical protein ENI88_08340 [Desulfobulbus sp.]|nr:hypothetical protein [Desulfobulbus sp.]